MTTILRAKCLIVGDPAVGKSALTQVFHSDGVHFPKNYSMTTSAELCVKSVVIPDTTDSVEMYLYDCAGKDTFTEYIQKFWDQASVLMVVFDISNETSFNNCMKWVEKVRNLSPDIMIPGVLVGSKTDLQQRRIVSTKEGREFAVSKGLEYFECSAKEQENVDAPFHFLANAFYHLFIQKAETVKSLSI